MSSDETGRPGPCPLRWPSAALLALALVPTAAFAGEVAGNGAPPTDPLLLQPSFSGTLAPLAPAPSEPELPFYDLDWSLGLRGSYINDSSSGVRYQGLVLPSATLTHTGKYLSFHGGADAQFSKTDGDAVNVQEARLAGGSALQFGPDSSLTSNASLTLSQEDPNSPTVPTDVATPPTEISGAADSTFTRKFGSLNLSASANAGRDVYGPTTLGDGTTVDNASLNNTSAGGGLRLGYQLTPVLELFTSGNATRTMFDAASPTLSTKLDGNLYTVKAGVSAKWDSRLAASASVGTALEHFDDPGLADVRATLYDASLTFKPTDTLTLDGAFTTTVGAPGPDGSGTASIEYAATAAATYQVNDWLDWRASAGWSETRYVDSSQSSRGYDLGVGADYALSRHAKLSADYNFGHSEVSPNPPDDTHTVTLGLTLQK